MSVEIIYLLLRFYMDPAEQDLVYFTQGYKYFFSRLRLQTPAVGLKPKVPLILGNGKM
jgi:hypothetical protein